MDSATSIRHTRDTTQMRTQIPLGKMLILGDHFYLLSGFVYLVFPYTRLERALFMASGHMRSRPYIRSAKHLSCICGLRIRRCGGCRTSDISQKGDHLRHERKRMDTVACKRKHYLCSAQKVTIDFRLQLLTCDHCYVDT